jgi:hypothetical protein
MSVGHTFTDQTWQAIAAETGKDTGLSADVITQDEQGNWVISVINITTRQHWNLTVLPSDQLPVAKVTTMEGSPWSYIEQSWNALCAAGDTVEPVRLHSQDGHWFISMTSSSGKWGLLVTPLPNAKA